jgi:predicted DNA-binding transcriptional regulator AlpA
VHWVGWAHKLPSPPTQEPEGELSVRQVAETLGISAAIIYDWINTGKLAARRGPNGRLSIPFPPTVEQQSRQRIADSRHVRKPKPLMQEV